MDSPFFYRDNRLFCEEVDLLELAGAIGTPCYLYSWTAIAENFRRLDRAFGAVDHLVCYAVKANPSLAILRGLGDLGAGADIVSGGELFRAQRAGIPSDRIVFSGVGKTQEELEQAVRAGVRSVNLESLGEINVLARVAERAGRVQPVAVRVNPEVTTGTHEYVATAEPGVKFGIPLGLAETAIRAVVETPHLRLSGLAVHLGSQLTGLEPYVEALERLRPVAAAAAGEGASLEFIDVGGGLGIRYEAEEPPSPEDWAKEIIPLAEEMAPQVVIEPGRSIVGPAGALLTEVLYQKEGTGRRFVVVDAGMNDLIRPSLYQAYHEVRPIVRREGPEVTVDVVGPVCESADFLALDRRLSPVESGDLLAVLQAGAYAASMASRYNSRRQAPEVLVQGDRFVTIRERGVYGDLVRGEAIPVDFF